MNKKQFLLLSLLAYTTLPQANLQASSAGIRKILTSVGILTGLVTGGYGTAIVIIGNNNKAIPALNNESELGLQDSAAKRVHPYQHAFDEVNRMIAKDLEKCFSEVTDAFNKLTTAASQKPATAPSKTTENPTDKNE